MQDKIFIQQHFNDFLRIGAFPCVAAKDALAKSRLKVFVAGHLGCPSDDAEILKFIYEFISDYRKMPEGFHSAAIIFPSNNKLSEIEFDTMMWTRLAALQKMDAVNYQYDKRVNDDPQSSDYSFSLMEEAFFIVGMHPGSSRAARRSPYSVLIFNPHQQFEKLKKNDRYEKLKTIVRKRDIAFSGSLNPMLSDFGKRSEIFQYSGRKYNDEDECPYKQ